MDQLPRWDNPVFLRTKRAKTGRHGVRVKVCGGGDGRESDAADIAPNERTGRVVP